MEAKMNKRRTQTKREKAAQHYKKFIGNKSEGTCDNIFFFLGMMFSTGNVTEFELIYGIINTVFSVSFSILF